MITRDEIKLFVTSDSRGRSMTVRVTAVVPDHLEGVALADPPMGPQYHKACEEAKTSLMRKIYGKIYDALGNEGTVAALRGTLGSMIGKPPERSEEKAKTSLNPARLLCVKEIP